MVTIHSMVKPHPDVVCTELKNGESVLLHLQTHTYFSLNETGTRIWSLMGKGLTMEQIGQSLEAVYDVSSERAHNCVLELVTALQREELVTTSHAS